MRIWLSREVHAIHFSNKERSERERDRTRWALIKRHIYPHAHHLPSVYSTVWSKCDCWHGMHIRFRNILDDNRNIKLPSTQSFIIRSRNKSTILIHKRNSIHGPKMLIVFLYYFSRCNVKLINLLVSTSSQENILLFGIRIEFYAVGDTFCGESTNAFTLMSKKGNRIERMRIDGCAGLNLDNILRLPPPSYHSLYPTTWSSYHMSMSKKSCHHWKNKYPWHPCNGH